VFLNPDLLPPLPTLFTAETLVPQTGARLGDQVIVRGVRLAGATDWQPIIDLYDRLYKLTRSPVVAVNLSAAIANVRGAEVALKLLDELAGGSKLHGYQPYWATSAHLLEQANRRPEAKFAYQRAIGLSADPRVRDFLLVRCELISRHGLS
jgi:predicted RNA polymerase sigma factor